MRVFLFVFLFSFSLHASPSVVKVVSRQSATPTFLQGSGLGFVHGGEAFVLTSDHVVLHENKGIVHRVFDAKSGWLDAEYVVSDFGHGLALLKIKNPQLAQNWKDWSALVVAEAKKGDSTIVYGYPASSNTLIRSGDGVVSDAAMSDGILIAVKSLVEVAGAHGEFGMSGGPVTDQTGQYLGTLSHQKYKEGPGEILNDLVFIPASVTIAWVNRFLKDPTQFTVDLVQSLHSQLWQNWLTFDTGSLFVSLSNYYGTGRNYMHLSPTESQSTELYSEDAGGLKQIEELEIKTDCSVLVGAFRSKGDWADRGSFSNHPIEFFRMFSDQKLEPVGLRLCQTSGDDEKKLEALHDKLIAIARPKPAASLRQLYEAFDIVLSRTGPVDSVPSEMPQYAYLKSSDIDRILGSPEYQGGWKALQQTGHDIEFRQIMTEIRDALEWLSL
ncbi:MAG: trypsin-like peptidase domain-containing protein [Bdellovibrionales bacterium]|nr:trypsin-like peptidase domain-containing protein [Bdellovibrionales bacterium]